MPKGTQEPIHCHACRKGSHQITPTQMAEVIEAFARGDLHRVGRNGVIETMCFAGYLARNARFKIPNVIQNSKYL